MVVVLRLTRKLLARVGPTTPDPPASMTILGDWFGHLVFVGHRRYVLLVSEHSRLPVLLPGRDLKNLSRNFPEALGRVLQALGIPEEAVAGEVDATRCQVSVPVFHLSSGTPVTVPQVSNLLSISS